MLGRIALCLFLPLVVARGELSDQKLSSILGELVDLRSELNGLFQSPRKQFENEAPDSEWVVHIDRGVAEAQWIANLTNTKFVGPMRGFPDLYVFRSFMPQNGSETHRIRRDLSERQRREQIYWSELQTSKARFKRDINSFNDPLWQVSGHFICKQIIAFLSLNGKLMDKISSETCELATPGTRVIPAKELSCQFWMTELIANTKTWSKTMIHWLPMT
jgi:hypothetical protein